jgi:hypothetical protein
MAHCGYEPTAADAAVRNVFEAAKVAILGPRLKGPMAPEISLANQRPAEYVHGRHVENMLTKLEAQTRGAPPARRTAAPAAE